MKKKYFTEGRNKNKKVHFAGDDEVDEVHYDEEHMLDRDATSRPLMDSNIDTDMADVDEDDGEPMTMQKRLLKLAGHDPVFIDCIQILQIDISQSNKFFF